MLAQLLAHNINLAMATLNQALCSLLVFACIATTTASAADRPPAPTHKEVSDAIHLASGYLVHACDENGKFAYKVSLLSGDESPSYNILRHAGTMYALAMLYQTEKDPAIAHTLVLAAAYMRHNYIAPDGPTGNLVVWSRPAPDHAQAALGATGPGLVALAAVRRMQPDTVPLSAGVYASDGTGTLQTSLWFKVKRGLSSISNDLFARPPLLEG